MLPPIPETLRSTLNDINPYFQEYLESNFEDENRRRRDRRRNVVEVPSVLCVEGNKLVLLKNLKIMQQPDFKKRSFNVRLEGLCIDITLELEKLTIEGNYEEFNKDSSKPELNGNIIFVLENTVMEGLIPIHIVEDSFVVNENFALNFIPTQIITKKSWKVDGKIETSETVESDKDQTLMKLFWPGLLNVIFETVFRDIAGPIVEYSVTELFADEPQEMRDLSEKRIGLANKLCDNILDKSKAMKDKNTIEVPDLNFTFVNERSSTPCSIFFKNGTLSNVLNTKRSKSFAINEEADGSVLYLSGGLEIREITLSFDNCLAKYGNVESKGTCKLSFYRTRIFFKASLRKIGESYGTKLENIGFRWVRDIDYDFKGLECLSNVQDDVKCYLLSYFEGDITKILTQHLEGIYRDIVKDYDMSKVIFT